MTAISALIASGAPAGAAMQLIWEGNATSTTTAVQLPGPGLYLMFLNTGGSAAIGGAFYYSTTGLNPTTSDIETQINNLTAGSVGIYNPSLKPYVSHIYRGIMQVYQIGLS